MADDGQSLLRPGRRSVRTDGVDLSYVIMGRGPVLFAVSSGWGVGSGYLERGLAPLVADFTLVCIATRGSGRSTRPADETAMGTETMAEDIDHLRRHLQLETIDLFGHSHGGAIAMAYAARHPAACRKLILADSQLLGMRAPEATEAILQRRAGDPRFQGALDNLRQAGGLVFEDEAITRLLFSTFALYFHDPVANMQTAIDTFDLPIAAWATEKQHKADALAEAKPADLLSRIRAETLVLVGSEDVQTPVVVSERISDGIQGSKLVVLRDCGHLPWIEQPELFFTAVRDFALAPTATGA